MYEKRLTAFIDILGFKDIIDLCENDSKLVESIYKILNFILLFLEICFIVSSNLLGICK